MGHAMCRNQAEDPEAPPTATDEVIEELSHGAAIGVVHHNQGALVRQGKRMLEAMDAGFDPIRDDHVKRRALA